MIRTGVGSLVACLGTTVLVGATPTLAQVRAGLGGVVSTVSDESSVSGIVTKRTGVMVGTQGFIALGRVDLSFSYRQGTASASGGSSERDLVEGDAALGVGVARWLRLEIGPHVRSYVTPGFTERWLFWEGRANFDARLLGPSVRSYLILSRVLRATVSPASDFGSGQSAEAGVTVRLGRSPLWSGLGYWIAQSSAGGGQRVETLQGLSIGLAVR